MVRLEVVTPANLGDRLTNSWPGTRQADGTSPAAGGMDVRVANARVRHRVDLARLTNVDLQGMELGGGIAHKRLR